MPEFVGLQPLPERHLGHLLLHATRLVDGAFQTALELRGFGDVRRSHFAVFRSMDAGGTTVTTLAHRAAVSRQAMSQLVGDLATLGYLTVTPDPVDRRAVMVRLTTQGHRFYDAAAQVGRELEAHWESVMGRRRLAGLRAGLIALLEMGDPLPTPAARPSKPRKAASR